MVDEPDPEFDRLLAWFVRDRKEIAAEFGAQKVTVSPQSVVFQGDHGEVIKTIIQYPNSPCCCGSGKKYKRCCGKIF